jgi:hypothetical protein
MDFRLLFWDCLECRVKTGCKVKGPLSLWVRSGIHCTKDTPFVSVRARAIVYPRSPCLELTQFKGDILLAQTYFTFHDNVYHKTWQKIKSTKTLYRRAVNVFACY